MDMRQLKYFRDIALLGSYRKAAQSLHISQPALTRQVLALEDELNAILFLRGREGVELTAAGKLLLGHSELLLSQLEVAREQVRECSNHTGIEMGVGAPPGLGQLLFGQLAEVLSRDYPDMHLRFYENPSNRLLELMNEGTLDIAVLSQVSGEEFIAEHLVDEQVYLLSRPDDDMPAEIDNLRKLQDLPLILAPSGNEKAWLETFSASHSIRLNIRHRASSAQIMKELVVRGIGYALLAESGIQPEVKAGLIRASKLHGFTVPRFLVRRRDRYPNPMLGTIGQHLRELVRQIQPH